MKHYRSAAALTDRSLELLQGGAALPREEGGVKSMKDVRSNSSRQLPRNKAQDDRTTRQLQRSEDQRAEKQKERKENAEGLQPGGERKGSRR